MRDVENTGAEGRACFACRRFARACVRHLLNVNEIPGLRLVSIHHSHVYLELMGNIRAHLTAGTFAEFRREFIAAPWRVQQSVRNNLARTPRSPYCFDVSLQAHRAPNCQGMPSPGHSCQGTGSFING